jgi:hypothetical protein
VIVGVVFVVQPPFLTETFPGLAHHSNVVEVRASPNVSSASNVTSDSVDEDISDEDQSQTYAIGVVLALSYAAGCEYQKEQSRLRGHSSRFDFP